MNFSDIFSNNHVNINFDSDDKCAIVGNSGVLLENEYGSFIDSHDFVLRMNAAPIEGYQKYVGSKTTMRIVNGTLLKGRSVDQTNTQENWIRTLKNEKVLFGRSKMWAYENAIMELVNLNEIYFPSDKVNNSVNKVEKRFRLRLASTGLYSLIIFSEFFGEVNGFGFGFHQDNLDKRHYWESYDSEHEVNHEWKKEKRAVKRLEKRNKFKIH